MSVQTHQSDPRILRRRTLERDHRHLATLLRPALSVLDVGCGTGAITAGIAKAVGPASEVIGVDRDAALLEIARAEHGHVSNLRFEQLDAAGLDFRRKFDIVSAARTLQWISDPGTVVRRMQEAAKPGGLVVVLDYTHTGNHWEPDPPASFVRFYEVFLAWREFNGWDNRMADHLPALFEVSGLEEVEVHCQDEVAEQGQLEFDERAVLWLEVIEGLGTQLVSAGFLSRTELNDTAESYAAWIRTGLRRQTLILRAVVGRAPL